MMRESGSESLKSSLESQFLWYEAQSLPILRGFKVICLKVLFRKKLFRKFRKKKSKWSENAIKKIKINFFHCNLI